MRIFYSFEMSGLTNIKRVILNFKHFEMIYVYFASTSNVTFPPTTLSVSVLCQFKSNITSNGTNEFGYLEQGISCFGKKIGHYILSPVITYSFPKGECKKRKGSACLHIVYVDAVACLHIHYVDGVACLHIVQVFSVL